MLDPLGLELQIVMILEWNTGPLEGRLVLFTTEPFGPSLASPKALSRQVCSAVKGVRRTRRESERMREEEALAALNL